MEDPCILLGIDGGGTATNAILCTARGEVISRAAGGASGLTGRPEDAVYETLNGLLEKATARIGGREGRIRSVYACFSGAGQKRNAERYRDMLGRLLPGTERIGVGSDALSALTAGIGTGDGIIAIAGTGSGVFARRAGVMHQVGGWGYLIGDEGSGYDLGRRALNAALRAADGRGKKTILIRLCEEQAHCQIRDLVPSLYSGDGRRMIASFAPVILTAAQAGDAVALREVRRASEGMAEAILAAGTYGTEPLVVMSGSVWKNDLYRDTVSGLLPDHYQLIRPVLPPVCGSVLLAAGAAGIPEHEEFKLTLRESLKEGPENDG